MRKKLFWIIYYGITISGIIVATIRLREHVNFNWFSAFPIVSALLLIAQFFFLPSRLRIRLWVESFERGQYTHGYNTVLSPENEEELFQGELPFARMAAKIALFCIPFVIMFVCFFSKSAKIVVSFMALLPYIIMYTNLIISCVKEAKENDKKRARELEEQKNKEKNGYIK
ncbi:MAG: hypothetical protein E7585_05565 [Ruminococcaceae bacterium]|nr:hypothetical protein [Oscillospiraceae bacterium]